MILKKTQTTLIVLALFFVSLFIFTWGLLHQEIIGFESRFYLFALEMWRNGPSWFPTTYQQPYPDYPATSTFLIYLAAHAFGGLNKLTAVLPTAIAAAMMVVFTYLIGALQNKRWGLYAVFFLFLTVAFLKSARSLSLDLYPAMITAICFYWVYAADVKRDYRHPGWIYPLLILSFAFRGPIGIVIPTGVICIYYLLDGKFKKFFLTGFFAACLLILCTLLFLALSDAIGGEKFMQAVLRMEVFGRMEHGTIPFYFYFLTGFTNYLLSFIVAIFVMVGAISYAVSTKKITPAISLLLKLTGWVLIILIGMSIPGDKKVRYVLSISPALALLAAYPFIAPAKEKYFAYVGQFFLRFFLLMPTLFVAAILLLGLYAHEETVHFAIPYTLIALILLIVQLISIWLFKRFSSFNSRATNVLFIFALCFILINQVVIEPIELYVDRARAFVQQIEKARHLAQSQLVFYKEKSDGLPIKYLINMQKNEPVFFILDEKELTSITEPAFFVTSAAYFNALPKSISEQYFVIGKDSLGHVPVVVFKKIKKD